MISSILDWIIYARLLKDISLGSRPLIPGIETTLSAYPEFCISKFTASMISSILDVSSARGDIEIVAVPTSELAEKIGTIKVANMIMLGAFIRLSNIISYDFMIKNLTDILGEGKAKLIKLNKEALEMGFKYVKE